MNITNNNQISTGGLEAVLSTLNKMKTVYALKRSRGDEINNRIEQVSELIIETHKINIIAMSKYHENT